MTSNDSHKSRPVNLAAGIVVFAAAVSAGIHAGLVPEHLEAMPLLGISFALAVAALIGAGAAVAVRPRNQLPASLAALLFGTLILAYTASRTTGLPVLEPEPEAVDVIGIITVAVQFVGAIAALWLTREAALPRTEERSGTSGSVPYRVGTLSLAGLVAIAFTVLALNGFGTGEGHGHGHDEGHHHHDAPSLGQFSRAT